MGERETAGRSVWKGRLIEMPFAFTGMGLFRAWTETVYSNGALAFPAQDATGFGFAAFNMIAAVVLVALALSSRRIAPLYGKRAVPWVTGACMIASACLNFSTIYFPGLAPFFGAPAAVLGAVGIALIILLWSELFGCLNPFRVALYFSGGLVVGALVLWLFKGLAIPWLWVCTCLVPVVSLVCLRRAYDLLPDDERPRRSWGTFSFPWKPIAVMALYSLAYGMCERVFGSELGIHSGLGCVAAAGAVYLVVCLRRDRLHLSFAYRAACPLLLASLLPLWMLGPIGGELASFCALAAYTFVLIVIMVVLSNLTYQYGFNAVWLFGIERAVRLVSVQAGLAATEALTDSSFGYLALCVVVAVAVVVATALFLSEKQLTTPWGTVLKTLSGQSFGDRSRIGAKCDELSKQFGLTSREAEILTLLAQGKQQGQIAHDLYIAPSTVKTHIKHLYQKLGVHSRKGLCDLVGVEAGRAGCEK